MRELKWGLLATYLAACSIAWPRLPQRIPLHFNARGIVDNWVDTSLRTWFFLPAVLVATIVFLALLTRAITSNPRLWNVPNKQYFVSLSDEERAPVYHEMRAFMDVLSCGMVVLFAGIQYVMFATATRGRTGNPVFMLPLLTVAFTAVTIAYAIRLIIRIRRIIPGSSAGTFTGHAR